MAGRYASIERMDSLRILKKSDNRRPVAVRSAIAAAGITAGTFTSSTEDRAPEEQTYESESFAKGTIITQKVTGAKGQAAIEEVKDKIRSLEKQLTFMAPEGDVYKLNTHAGTKEVPLDPATVKIIKKALQVAELSGGAYDITAGPLVRIWAIGTPQQHVPSQEELQKILPLVNYKDVYVDEHSGGLRKNGQMIDLGGIAKGHAGDAAIQIYKHHQRECGPGTRLRR
jgi:thiamine biosynthesis lipoprotein